MILIGIPINLRISFSRQYQPDDAGNLPFRENKIYDHDARPDTFI
jgi:hypothetical protein